MPADYVKSELPDLKKYQEEQVNKTVEVSKKIVEAESWKSIERDFGEVFTQNEKEILRSLFHNKFKQFDLVNLDKRLKENYYYLDWDRVNEQLLIAENKVRTDSIQNVISLALSNLENIKNRIITRNLINSPDAIITLAEIDKAQKDLRNQLKEIKDIKKKKVVHL
jgi:hypothetical protein